MTIFDPGPTRDRNDAAAELGRIGTLAVGFAGLMGVIACMGAVHLGALGAAALLVLWTVGVVVQFYAATQLREQDDEQEAAF
jgi:hypothetical protein